MASTIQPNSNSTQLNCRRKGERQSLPIEVRIEIAGREICGIVRDITVDKSMGPQAIGISLMHFEPLSVRREYICRTVNEIPQLPNQFTVSIRWCRYFEDEAFISGGQVSDPK